jgi:hypothetical protein
LDDVLFEPISLKTKHFTTNTSWVSPSKEGDILYHKWLFYLTFKSVVIVISQPRIHYMQLVEGHPLIKVPGGRHFLASAGKQITSKVRKHNLATFQAELGGLGHGTGHRVLMICP